MLPVGTNVAVGLGEATLLSLQALAVSAITVRAMSLKRAEPPVAVRIGGLLFGQL